MDIQHPGVPIISLPYQAYPEQGITASLCGAQEYYSDESFRRSEIQKSYSNLMKRLMGDQAPTFIAGLFHRLSHTPYSVIIRNIPESFSLTCLAGISASLGRVTEPLGINKGQILKEIRPSLDKTSHGKALNESLHTDSTDWPIPNDITALLCVRPDSAGGGQTKLTTIDDILWAAQHLLPKKDQKWLTDHPLTWNMSSCFDEKTIQAPIIEHGMIRWMEYTTAPRNKAEKSFIQRILSMIEAETKSLRLELQASDLLLINNRKCLHARTSVDDENSDRVLVRAKIISKGGPS